MSNYKKLSPKDPFVRRGAEIEYEMLLKRLSFLRRTFPGIDKTVVLKMQQAQAALARAAKAMKQ